MDNRAELGVNGTVLVDDVVAIDNQIVVGAPVKFAPLGLEDDHDRRVDPGDVRPFQREFEVAPVVGVPPPIAGVTQTTGVCSRLGVRVAPVLLLARF